MLKRALIGAAIAAALSLSACVPVPVIIAATGAASTAVTAGFDSFCAATTDESARAKAGCDALKE